MVRQIQVTVPHGKVSDVNHILENSPHVFGLQNFPGTNSTLLIFKMAEKRVSPIINELCQIGVGTERGTIDIVQLASTIPRLESKKTKKKAYRMDDRMTTFEIFDAIDGQAHLTCDYLANVFVAAMIAAAGLISDSSVTVVASMLVSPLMGPILCVTFGAAIEKREMVTRGIRNEAYGMLICVVVGMLAGLLISPFYGPGGLENEEFNEPLQSNEVDSRGDIYALIPGVFVAIPSGMGVALGMTAGGINALVGVAISAALLPPMVNVGLCFSLGLWYMAYDEQEAGEAWIRKSGCSLALYLTNIVCIFVMAMIVFKLKNVSKSSMVERKVVRWNASVEEIFLPGDKGFWCCCKRRRNSAPLFVEDAEREMDLNVLHSTNDFSSVDDDGPDEDDDSRPSLEHPQSNRKASGRESEAKEQSSNQDDHDDDEKTTEL